MSGSSRATSRVRCADVDTTEWLSYSGTLTSPFFGKPTAVSGMRKIDAGINLNF